MNKSNRKQIQKAEPFLLSQNESSESGGSESTISDEDEQIDHKTATIHHNICKCQEKYIKIKKRSSKQVIVSKQSCWEADELSARRQKLELQLINSQMEESVRMDQHNILHMRFERLESTMEAVLQYLDCLELEVKASYRLCQQLNGLIVNEKSVVITESLSQLVKKLCDGTTLEEHSCKETIMAALEATKSLDGLITEYNDKKKDYHTASQNFKLLLQNANLNLAQLEKLQRQFDGILLSYQHSRCMLDQELPEIISNRMQVLLNSFNELGTDLEKIASDRTDLSSLLKHLESSLRTCNDLVAIKGNLHEVPVVGGAIMCGNCSRSPAIAGD
ncbi:hypothetical protein ILUMI_24398 [Ignelater luminosus]|uniref:Uncharacterized protein n=1 Tax=Ignelater luminosus TaxID=2038154 RepID=A0A8K0G110_IGNLU|nr:hypothetical protein ILUMI_24398 [Ignelater luminosus]